MLYNIYFTPYLSIKTHEKRIMGGQMNGHVFRDTRTHHYTFNESSTKELLTHDRQMDGWTDDGRSNGQTHPLQRCNSCQYYDSITRSEDFFPIVHVPWKTITWGPPLVIAPYIESVGPMSSDSNFSFPNKNKIK